MSNLAYVVGLVLSVATFAAVVATQLAEAHSRTARDHDPDCWWCHPRLLPRKRR